MSHHILKTLHAGHPATVMAGFDRPLQGFFCVAYREVGDAGSNAPDDDPGPDYLYSNMADHDLIASGGFASDLDYFVAKLAEFGLAMPAEMLSEISLDCANNTGNRQASYVDPRRQSLGD